MATIPSTPTLERPAGDGRELGRYRLLEPLARGDTAESFAALRDGGRELCVLKQIRSDLQWDQIVQKRFAREANVAARLVHPGIVRTIEVGQHGDGLAIVTEFVPGATLEQVLVRLRESWRPVPVGVAVAITRELLEALAYAHDAADEGGRPLGLVHRELSPSNLLIGFAGEVKIIDFGVVRSTADDFRTAPGVVVGALGYLSPEQALGQEVDRRSDLYTVAVVLWEMLSGRPLVRAEAISELMRAIVEEVPPTVQRLRPDVPPLLSAVVERALAKTPDRRYQTALDFKAALAGLPEASRQERAAFLRKTAPDVEARVLELIERGRQLLAREEPAAFDPDASLPLARYEPTAMVERSSLRRSGSQTAVTEVVRSPRAPRATVEEVPLEGTGLGAMVLEMPGETQPMGEGTRLRLSIGVFQRRNARILPYAALLLAGMGLLVGALLWNAPQEERAVLVPVSLEAPVSAPQAVSRGGGAAPPVELAPVRPARAEPPVQEAREEPAAAATPSSSPPAEVAGERRAAAPASPPRTKAPGAASAPRSPAPPVGEEPPAAAKEQAAQPPPAAEAARAPHAELRRMLRELRESPKSTARFDALSRGIAAAAESLPAAQRSRVRSELQAAELSFDPDLLARALEELIRAEAR